MTLTCLFVKAEFKETHKDFSPNYPYNNKLIRQTNTINFNGISYTRFRWGWNNWLGQILEETTLCSTKLMQLNYSHLKILKLKIHSLFGHTFFCPCYLVTRFYYLSHSCLFLSLSFSMQNPQFLLLVSLKSPLELTKDLKWPPFAK